MVPVKNYETMSKFVKVVSQYSDSFFSGHGVYNYQSSKSVEP